MQIESARKKKRRRRRRERNSVLSSRWHRAAMTTAYVGFSIRVASFCLHFKISNKIIQLVAVRMCPRLFVLCIRPLLICIRWNDIYLLLLFVFRAGSFVFLWWCRCCFLSHARTSKFKFTFAHFFMPAIFILFTSFHGMKTTNKKEKENSVPLELLTTHTIQYWLLGI